MDAGNFLNATILDPLLGFGGNGSGPNSCITDGPFKDYVNHLGPFYTNTDHCLNRKINETMSNRSAQYFVDDCMSRPNFVSAWTCIEDMPHAGGHGGINGQVGLHTLVRNPSRTY
jgi:tyrosinase